MARISGRAGLAYLLLALAAVLVLTVSSAFAQETVQGVKPIAGFDHSQVGIPLTGKHADIICESCHIDNQLKGTPRECVACHNGTRAPGKKPGHPPAGNNCQQCHTTKNFVPFAFDHVGVNQPCATCHNGANAFGKPANHIKTNDTCDDCHVTTNRKTVRVDHRDVIGTCVSCHNGVTAPGKIKGHIAAPDDCAACHSTLQFAGARVDHSKINQPCATCHVVGNPVGAPPPPVWHLPAQIAFGCENCHTPAGFEGASMMHLLASGDADCVSCHFTNRGMSSAIPDPNGLSKKNHEPGLACTQCHIDRIDPLNMP